MARRNAASFLLTSLSLFRALRVLRRLSLRFILHGIRHEHVGQAARFAGEEDPIESALADAAVAAVKLKELWEEAGREESKRVLRLLLSLAMERGRSLLAEVVKERGKEPRQREVRELLLKTEAIYRESFSNASAEVLLAAFLSSFL